MWCYVRYHSTTTTTTTTTNITYLKGVRFASEEMKVVFDYKTKLGLILIITPITPIIIIIPIID